MTEIAFTSFSDDSCRPRSLDYVCRLRWGVPCLVLAVLLGPTILLIAGALPHSRLQRIAPATVPDLEDPIRRVENGIPQAGVGNNEPQAKATLAKLMEKYYIPGLSVAVIDNFQISWAKGYGVTESGGHTPVTTHTLFQAGSVSKPIAAIAAMSLVEQGMLSFDEDVYVRAVVFPDCPRRGF